MLSLPRLCTVARVPTTRAIAQRNSGGYVQHNFENFKKSYNGHMKDAETTKETWKKIFFIASIPCLAMSMYAAFQDHSSHMSHSRPEHVGYSYLNVRNKPFPWGDGNHSLFHNKEEQYVPGVGFEAERPKHGDHH